MNVLEDDDEYFLHFGLLVLRTLPFVYEETFAMLLVS